MGRIRRRWITALAIGASLALSGISAAALLGIDNQISLPIIQFDGGTTIVTSTGDFSSTVSNGFMAVQLDDGAFLISDNSLTVHASLDAACGLVGGVPGDDLVLRGDIGSGTVDLLTGEVTEFGFTEQTGSLQEFDFRFTITGGSLASEFTNEDLGLVITSLNSTFAGSCSVNSGGGAKGRMGAIPPPQPATGCTPGYWKQKHHFDSWVPTGYVETQTVSSAFGAVDPTVDALTLEDALKQGGGGLKALMRHAVAALLNAAHPDVNSVLTVQQVIDAVQAAVNGGDIEATKNTLEQANEEGCPLN